MIIKFLLFFDIHIMSQQPSHPASFIFLGHVDSGKSTVCGHLAYLMGAFNEETLRRCQLRSLDIGKGSFKFAWLVSKLQQERQRGITIVPSVVGIRQGKRIVTFIDSSGHRDFIVGTIRSLCQADCGILIVATTGGEFQAGISKDGQTRTHILVSYLMGITRLIVCLNKMDDVKYSEQRYNEVKTQMLEYILKVGFKKDHVTFIPICGFYGDNLKERSAKMPWYEGPTLSQAVISFEPPNPKNMPLRISIFDCFKIGGIGTVVTGRVLYGTIKNNDTVAVVPINKNIEARTIERNHESIAVAEAGERIGFHLRMTSIRDVRKGDVIGVKNHNPPKLAKFFKARVLFFNFSQLIRKGYRPLVICHTTKSTCRIEGIIQKIDNRTGKTLEMSPEHLKEKESGIIFMKPEKPFCCQLFSDYPLLGRFTMMDSKNVIGGGIITEIERE